MSEARATAAHLQHPRSRRARRTATAVIAQYIQDLSAAQPAVRRSAPEPGSVAFKDRVLPARVVPIHC